MEKYRKIEKPKEVSPPDQIRVSGVGQIRSYVTYAAKLLNEMKYDAVTIRATGKAVSVAVSVAEVVKRRFRGLHQVTTIGVTQLTNEYEPLEEGLDPIAETRTVPFVSIKLARGAEAELMARDAPGYQPPLDDSLVKELDPSEVARTTVRRGRGRGGGRRGSYPNRGGGGGGGMPNNGPMAGYHNYGGGRGGRGSGMMPRGGGRGGPSGGWRGSSMGVRSPPQQHMGGGGMGGGGMGGGMSGGGMGGGGMGGGGMGGGGMGGMGGGGNMMMNSDAAYSTPHDDYGRGARWSGRGNGRRPRGRGSFRGSRGYGRPRGRGGRGGGPDMSGRMPNYPHGGGPPQYND